MPWRNNTLWGTDRNGKRGSVVVSTRSWSVVVPVGYVVSRWQVTAPIATGSWGSVYEARLASGPERESGQETEPEPEPPARPCPASVAVKFLPTGTITQRHLAHLADMARREQEVYQQLQHPRLVELVATVVIEDPDRPELDGAVALVTERAEASVADVIVRAAGNPVPDAPRLLTEICEGLAHMHAAGDCPGSRLVTDDAAPGPLLSMSVCSRSLRITPKVSSRSSRHRPPTAMTAAIKMGMVFPICRGTRPVRVAAARHTPGRGH